MPSHRHRGSIGFGKYANQSIGQIIINDPLYIEWMLSHNKPNEKMEATADAARDLIRIFDAKAFVCKCQKCNKRAKKCYVYNEELSPYFWCRDCAWDVPFCFREIDTYYEAVNHANVRKDAMRCDAKKIIRCFAQAKGLTGRISKKQVHEFFSSSIASDTTKTQCLFEESKI